MELLSVFKWATGVLGISVVGLLAVIWNKRRVNLDYKKLGKNEGLQEGREKAQEKCQADKKLIWSAHKQEVKFKDEQIAELQKLVDSIRPPITDVDTGG